MQTTDGTFTIQLLPKLAPIAVNNFVHLAKTHFYDGVKFWRIISQFMVQTGDPTGTGTGGPGYTFKDEIHRKLRYGVGTVAMANSGPNTNGSQFFIVTGPGGSGLPPNYTIFGKVTSGMKTVRRIAMTPVGPNPYLSNNGQAEMSGPLKTVKITHITIHQS